MFNVPCVVEGVTGGIDIHVPSVEVFPWVLLEEVNVKNVEGHVGEYKFVGIDNVRVFDWSKVHPSEWSPELVRVNQSYE